MIISLTGEKGSGKDFFADHIIKKYNNFVLIKYASPLRDFISIIIDYNFIENKNETTDEFKKRILESDKESPQKTLFGFSSRFLIQNFAIYWNELYPQMFFNIVKNEIIEKNNKHNIVISDTRFPYEFDFLNEKNSIKIKIIKDEGTKTIEEKKTIKPLDINIDEKIMFNVIFDLFKHYDIIRSDSIVINDNKIDEKIFFRQIRDYSDFLFKSERIYDFKNHFTETMLLNHQFDYIIKNRKDKESLEGINNILRIVEKKELEKFIF